MKILAVCGSLRAASINLAALQVMASQAPSGVQMEVFGALGALPLFNPDLEQNTPITVQAWRQAIATSDAVVIASPEYAHGISGVIKNALDWLVSVESFAGKPVAVVNTSERAYHADQALRETLQTMAARLHSQTCITLPLLGANLSVAQMHESAILTNAFEKLFRALQDLLIDTG